MADTDYTRLLSQESRDGWRDTLAQLHCDLALTLCYNSAVSPEKMLQDHRGFHHRLNAILLGPRWAKKPQDMLIQMWGVIEMTTSYPHTDKASQKQMRDEKTLRSMNLFYPHMHIGIRLPLRHDERFQAITEADVRSAIDTNIGKNQLGLWLTFAPHGDYLLKACTERLGWAGYATKALPTTDFILLDDYAMT